jgi:hypothetical protein
MKKALVLLGVVLAINCATNEKPKFDYEAALNNSIGKVTYDQFLSGMGPPTSVVQGDQIFVATWSSSKTGAMAMPIGNMVVAMPYNHGDEFVLTFDKVTRLLRAWTYRKW